MDEPITVPESLDGLSDDELTELGTQIRERVESIADLARADSEALAEAESLIASYDRVEQALVASQEAAAERGSRVDSILGRFAPAEDATTEAEVEDDAEAEAEVVAEAEAEVAPELVEVAAATEEVVELAVEEVVEAAVEEPVETAAAEADVVETAVEDAVETATETEEIVELSTEDAAEEFAATDSEQVELATEAVMEAATETPEPQEGNQVAATNRPTAASLATHRPAAAAPVPATVAPERQFGSVSEGQTIDIKATAEQICEKRRAIGNTAHGIREQITVSSGTVEYGDRALVEGHIQNFPVLRSLTQDWAAFRAEQTAELASADAALVASGGVCAPIAPDYSFFRLAEEMNPVERCLPVAQAPRGGIRFIQPPDFRDAAPGVRVTTEAEDAAGYVSQGGPTADKPCVAVTCPDIQECRVDAVSRCVTFGNLNYRVFPEQVEAFLADLSVIFTETKEIFYLDAIDAASTPVTSIQTYSAVRTLVYDLLAAAANYRRRHHMAPNSTLQVLLPSWLPELLKVDMVNDHALGMSFIDADMGAINRFFAQANLDVCWYYDSATGAGQEFNTDQGVGDLNSFPSTTVSYLFAPGTFVRLDAGTLDVGLVRDSVLNGTNDLQLFAEQWIQVCMVGLESLRIEHTLCPDGTAPEPVTPLVCPTGNS